MILRPVTPESPCGPPTTNLPVGLMWQDQPVVDHLGGQDRQDHLLLDRLADRRVRDLRRVLGRDDHGVDPLRGGAVVLDRHLALRVGPEPGERAVLPQLGQPVDDPVRQGDRQRHQLGGLVAGVAEHHPLVAGADVLALGGVLVDPLGDVGRLLAQGDHDGAGGGVEAHLARGVADLADHLADDRRVIDHRLGRDLAGQADQAGRQQALARDAGVRVLRQDAHRECRRRSDRPSCRDGPSRPIRW